MDRETKQTFTRRLTQCNRSELVVITYEIYFAWEKDVRSAVGSDFESYKEGIHRMQAALGELMNALNFSYDISRQLYSLYRYCSSQLSRALYENRLDGVDEAEKVMKRLYGGFAAVAEQDTSEPLMRNVQQVYAGITYGKGELTENYMEDNNRGFFV